MGEFNKLAWASLKLPEGAQEVTASFEHAYYRPMLRNPSLAIGYKAATKAIDRGDNVTLQQLLTLGNQRVVDAILDSEDRSYNTVAALLKGWNLGFEDQMRLVNKALGPHVANMLIQTHGTSGFCEMAKYEASAQSGLLFTCSHCGPGEEPYYKQRTRQCGLGAYNKLSWVGNKVSVALDMSLRDLVSAATIEHLSSAVTRSLGANLTAWRMFFTLSESDSDATLREVLEVARNLVLA